MLDRVRRIRVPGIQARLFDRAVEQLARRSDERLSAPVLDVTGLLADKHEASAHRPLAEHRLRRVLVEMAALAGLGSGT